MGMLHVETAAIAQKKQEHKPDLTLEYAQMLPVIEIGMSDNMETRPDVVKRSF